MNHAANTWTQAISWQLRRLLLISALLGVGALFAQISPAHAGDRSDGSFGGDTSRWKRSANFVSDRDFARGLKRRRSAGVRRSRSADAKGSVPAFQPDQLLVAVSADSPEQLVDDIADEYKLSRLEDITVALLDQRIVKFKVASSKRSKVLKALRADPRIDAAQPNHLYVLGSDKTQYALTKLKLDEIHQFADGTDIRIAMLDSGVNPNHPAFGDLEIEQIDVTDGASSSKQEGHGTAVASLIAAQTGMKGVVPNPDLLSAKTFSYSPQWRRVVGETYHLLQGLDWAVFKKARVFNMSFAGPEDPLLRSALEQTLKTDAVLVAAAGNNGAKAPPAYPAAYEGVLAVTATDHRNRLYRHANRGNYVFLAAPGVNILSANGQEGYSRKSGTSLAAAHVTGIVALMMQTVPDASAANITKQLAATANDLGKTGRDKSFGHGMINPVKLVTAPALTN